MTTETPETPEAAEDDSKASIPDALIPEALRGREIKSNWDVLVMLYLLIVENRKWWLVPWLIVLAVLSLFVALTGSASILPAIYALF